MRKQRKTGKKKKINHFFYAAQLSLASSSAFWLKNPDPQLTSNTKFLLFFWMKAFLKIPLLLPTRDQKTSQ